MHYGEGGQGSAGPGTAGQNGAQTVKARAGHGRAGQGSQAKRQPGLCKPELAREETRGKTVCSSTCMEASIRIALLPILSTIATPTKVAATCSTCSPQHWIAAKALHYSTAQHTLDKTLKQDTIKYRKITLFHHCTQVNTTQGIALRPYCTCHA